MTIYLTIKMTINQTLTTPAGLGTFAASWRYSPSLFFEKIRALVQQALHRHHGTAIAR
jgi:hypothetical protein